VTYVPYSPMKPTPSTLVSSTVTPREGDYTGEVFNQTENAISAYLDLSSRNIPQAPFAHTIGSGRHAASGAGDLPHTKLEEILRSAPALQLVSSTHPRALTVRQGLTNCFHPKSGLVITTASLAGKTGYPGDTHALSLKPLTKPAVAGGGGQTLPVEVPSVGPIRQRKSARGAAGPQVGGDIEQCEVGSTACGSCERHPTGRLVHPIPPTDTSQSSSSQAQQLDYSSKHQTLQLDHSSQHQTQPLDHSQHPRPSPAQGPPSTPPLPEHSFKSPDAMV